MRLRNRVLAIVAAAAGVLIPSVPLFAHHGSAAFDTGKTVVMKGTVTRWFWANPHCFLSYDVKDETGNATHWVAETSNPPDMINRGWSKDTFKPGDEVTVTVEPVKNGRPAGRLLQVVLPDGKTLHYASPFQGPGN
jgi:Family of unknown function (DUF6152)